ncbi:Scr1 family TA system antitoxin-like transcriptional regulator [Streptomyces sp. DW26H14]|uniref:Scr1 family TA system antitoxin-like transcriptional regulator n=1 Tax=Streptomyces sp. DW26H14 TaxID=3435395 RepID=UPI00403E0ADA
MYVEWRRIHRTGIRQRQEADRGLYEQTRVVRVYCSNVIPGLLQTQGYAEALFATISEFQGTPNDAAEAAQARTKRSEVIRRGNHRFVLLMEETVLHYRIANPDVMAGQLGYLLDIASLPSVALGIIPFAARRGMRMWPIETFTLFDNDRAQVETLTAEINVTAPGEITAYTEAFGRLRRMAVYGPKARARITDAVAALE